MEKNQEAIEQQAINQELEMVDYCNINSDKMYKPVVAVIDTSYNVEEVQKGEIWKNDRELNNDFDDDENGFVDDMNGWNFNNNTNRIETTQICSHGTVMLNFIDDYNLKIMLITVLDDEGSGETSAIIDAIKYAENNGADICNLSFTTYEDNKELQDIIHQSKMLFIIAAGNAGEELKHENVCYPACYKENNIITVAACDEDYNIIEDSNYGEEYVDIVAPGQNITIQLANGYTTQVSGTSVATALVTRVVALVYSQIEYNFNPKEIKQLILETATKKDNLNGRVASSGIISMRGALKYLN
ncbi:MAG: S8 family serine peptidase [Clostridiales bacterium]|nr:S8 family serine peptidase [Clostridiales bacterium]